MSLTASILIFIILIYFGIDLSLKFSKIYKTHLDFDPKYKSIQKIKRTDILKLNSSIIVASIVFIFNTLLSYNHLAKDLEDPSKLILFITTIFLFVVEIIVKFTFNYYTYIFVYEEGLLIENTLISWDKCMVEKEKPSFITNGYVKISYEAIEKDKVVTKLIKVPRNTDVSLMKNVIITNCKSL